MPQHLLYWFLNNSLVSTLSIYDSTWTTTISDGTYISSLTPPNVSNLNTEITTNKDNYQRAISSLNPVFLDATYGDNSLNNQDNNSIILNASDISLNSDFSYALYIAPIRNLDPIIKTSLLIAILYMFY